jgi:hypothetical protein
MRLRVALKVLKDRMAWIAEHAELIEMVYLNRRMLGAMRRLGLKHKQLGPGCFAIVGNKPRLWSRIWKRLRHRRPTSAGSLLDAIDAITRGRP